VPTVRLDRFVATPHGTFGQLYLSDRSFYTVEEESLGNKPSVSCIPAGTYTCKPTKYHKGGYDTYEVMGVPGRSRILFHVANTEEDVEGCIGLGLNIGVLTVTDEDSKKKVPKLAVQQSKPAFTTFMRLLKGVPEFRLIVTDPC
jgi:hypothetical protein